MPTTSKVLEDMVRAVTELNQALPEDTEIHRQRRAVERLARALRQAVEHEPLWRELVAQATSAGPVDLSADGAREFLTFVGRFLSNAHATLLHKIGWRVPPPPPARKLVEQTRRAVLWGDRQPLWGQWHVEEARSALILYVGGSRWR